MEFEMSRDRLKRYFSDITYIDDKFDCNCYDEFESEKGTLVDLKDPSIDDTSGDFEGPPIEEPEGPNESFTDKLEGLKYPPTNTSEGSAELQVEYSEIISSNDNEPNINGNPTSNPLEDNLPVFLKELNSSKYDGFAVRPVLYTQNMDKDDICKQISNSHLTIIDWDLGTQMKAFPIIDQMLSNQKHLEVFVVYTACYPEAMLDLRENPKFKAYKIEEDSKHADISYCLCNRKSMIVIASKQHYSIPGLVDIIVDKFINTWGIMPIAVLEYIQKAQDISDQLFGSFSDPFSELYSLQMHFSEINEIDSSEMLTQFLQNKFRDACTTDSRIIRELFAFQRNKLVQFADDPHAENKFKLCIDQILPYFTEKNQEVLKFIQDSDLKPFLECCQDTKDKETWKDLISGYNTYFQLLKSNYIKSIVEQLLSAYDNIVLSGDKQEAARKNIEELSQRIGNEITPIFENLISEVFPVVIQMLISPCDILKQGFEFVANLKYKEYREDSLSKLLLAGKGLNKLDKAVFLHNQLHFGDILVKTTSKGTEYLLCITPPCDLFRPEKVNSNIMYIAGIEVKSSELCYPRKENSHISILPVKNPNGEKRLKYIKWRFFDIRKFSLSTKAEYAEFCQWSRPYMMSEPYARQISNKFTAYFSRAGVDELFMKSAVNLRRIFE